MRHAHRSESNQDIYNKFYHPPVFNLQLRINRQENRNIIRLVVVESSVKFYGGNFLGENFRRRGNFPGRNFAREEFTGGNFLEGNFLEP